MRALTLFLAIIVSIVSGQAKPVTVKWHNQSKDLTKINNTLTMARKAKSSGKPGDYVTIVARQFLGTPYVAHTLESQDGKEYLQVNLSELDCTTFVETVMALSQAAARKNGKDGDYLRNLESIRYRNGRCGDYASRLHYIADWATDNVARGNIEDVTGSIPGNKKITKRIDFMTTHRSSYPALASKAQYDKMLAVEKRLEESRYLIVPKDQLLVNKSTIGSLRDGDIVALTTNVDGLDVSHLGVIAIVNGEPHLLHASSKAKKVIVDSLTIGEYLANSKSLTGIRVFRMK